MSVWRWKGYFQLITLDSISSSSSMMVPSHFCRSSSLSPVATPCSPVPGAAEHGAWEHGAWEHGA
eukprot:109931-Prymnesium_polylepis.1